MPCDLILALDVPTRVEAMRLLGQLRGSVRWVKIGLQMFTACGPGFVREAAAEGYWIFLDLKLHDIPHTVARAVYSLNALPIGMLTIHAAGGRKMMAAASSGMGSQARRVGPVCDPLKSGSVYLLETVTSDDIFQRSPHEPGIMTGARIYHACVAKGKQIVEPYFTYRL